MFRPRRYKGHSFVVLRMLCNRELKTSVPSFAPQSAPSPVMCFESLIGDGAGSGLNDGIQGVQRPKVQHSKSSE